MSLIAAVARNGVIGRDGDLPWRLPADLKRFKETTLGNPIVMGRKTWESIGRPLPGRTNIVVSRQTDYDASGAIVVSSLSRALDAAAGADEVFVIGGAAIYREALPLASRIYMTELDEAFDGDVSFPPFKRSEWREVSREPIDRDEKNRHSFAFVVYERLHGENA